MEKKYFGWSPHKDKSNYIDKNYIYHNSILSKKIIDKSSHGIKSTTNLNNLLF